LDAGGVGEVIVAGLKVIGTGEDGVLFGSRLVDRAEDEVIVDLSAVEL